MNRYLLEYKGKSYIVESCATCPARTTDENGSPWCEIREMRIRAHIRGLFPTMNKYLGYKVCPVYREEIKKSGSKSGHKTSGPLYCSWCGNRINPTKAVIIINDKEPDRIYDRFECLSEYIRTK